MKTLTFFAVFAVLLSGCGYPYLGGTLAPSVAQSFSVEAVKQIAPEFTAGDTPEAYGQSHYEVGPEKRLLLRYENFSSHVHTVNLGADNSKKVWVQVAVESDPAEARARLELCPLVADWMMLATWRFAHPFGSAGRWQTAGSDYEAGGCVRAAPVPAQPDDSFKPDRIQFDMTQWFIDYPRGRGLNFGWVLKASDAVRVVGETSPGLSPRVLFEKYVGY